MTRYFYFTAGIGIGWGVARLFHGYPITRVEAFVMILFILCVVFPLFNGSLKERP